MRAIIVRKKFWGLQMLTWVWLARAKPELTKPKSTFRPQNFLSGLRAPHEQSFPLWSFAHFPAVGAEGSPPIVGEGKVYLCGACKPDKYFGGEMLTWVWLGHALHELTKPKSTFAAPKIFCG